MHGVNSCSKKLLKDERGLKYSFALLYLLPLSFLKEVFLLGLEFKALKGGDKHVYRSKV
jgi:hypothetical protein